MSRSASSRDRHWPRTRRLSNRWTGFLPATSGLWRVGTLWVALVLASPLVPATGDTLDGTGDSATVDHIRSYLDRRAETTGFSGAVLVVSGDRTLVREARGLAERELGVPLEPGHILPIGSLTKPITAVAALRLASAGRLELDAPICGYLPICPAAWAAVTVEHLLTHTSGVPDLFGDVECAPVEDTAAEIDKTITAADTTLEAAPGTEYSYNNFGYALLGYVMERATGELWETLLEREVFEPAGMPQTRYDDVWAIVPGRARGYEFEDGRVINIDYDDHCAYSAGGLHSTLDDLWRFLDATHRGTLLADDLRESAFVPRGGDFYGYGWAIQRQHGHQARTHSGGVGGFSSAFAHYPYDDLSIVLLSNIQEENANGTVCDLASLVLATDWRPYGDFDSSPPSDAEIQRYVGEWMPDAGAAVVISEVDGALRYARRGSRRSHGLIRVEGSLFALEGAEHLRIRFDEASDDDPGLTIERCGEIETRARMEPREDRG